MTELILSLTSPKSFSIVKQVYTDKKGKIKTTYRAQIILCGKKDDLEKISAAFPQMKGCVIANNSGFKLKIADSNCLFIIKAIYDEANNKEVLDCILELLQLKEERIPRRGKTANGLYEKIYDSYQNLVK